MSSNRHLFCFLLMLASSFYKNLPIFTILPIVTYFYDIYVMSYAVCIYVLRLLIIFTVYCVISGNKIYPTGVAMTKNIYRGRPI